MTPRRREYRRALVLGVLAPLLATAACFRRQATPTIAASAWGEWPATLDATTRHAAGGRYGAADSALVAFIARWPATAEADEGTYWRALLRVDPSNTTATGDATVQIDSAVARLAPGPRRDELLILRRLTVSLRALATEGATLRNSAAAADAKPKDDELAKLKEELARTQAELERVRRRVTRRPP